MRWIFFNKYDHDGKFIETVGYPSEIVNVYISPEEHAEYLMHEDHADQLQQEANEK